MIDLGKGAGLLLQSLWVTVPRQERISRPTWMR